jgi:hypothetical protein
MNLQGQSGASPAIDRNQGLHNVLDKAADKYKIVFEDTAGFDRAKGLAMTESALAGMDTPPQVIVAAMTTWRSAPWKRCAGAISPARSPSSASTRCPKRLPRSATAG